MADAQPQPQPQAQAQAQAQDQDQDTQPGLRKLKGALWELGLAERHLNPTKAEKAEKTAANKVNIY